MHVRGEFSRGMDFKTHACCSVLATTTCRCLWKEYTPFLYKYIYALIVFLRLWLASLYHLSLSLPPSISPSLSPLFTPSLPLTLHLSIPLSLSSSSPSFPLPRLELQVSSLEKDVESKQQALTKTEGQLTDLRTKYEATPKQEVMERLREDVKQLTEELQQTKNSITEWVWDLVVVMVILNLAWI